MSNIFLKPEKPFLVCFQVNKTRDYMWCESEEEAIEAIKDYKCTYDNFIIDDIVEIGSIRSLKIPKTCGECRKYHPYLCEQEIGRCENIAMLDVKPTDKCHKLCR